MGRNPPHERRGRLPREGAGAVARRAAKPFDPTADPARVRARCCSDRARALQPRPGRLGAAVLARDGLASGQDRGAVRVDGDEGVGR
ncbi:MAG: hypothetical protein ACPMAQ_11665, partial [Phycisphaerae bacterium]